MGKQLISNETFNKAKVMYKNKNLSIQEICNLLGMSYGTLCTFYKKCFDNGTLQPRQPSKVNKPRPPKGQGKPPREKHPRVNTYQWEMRKIKGEIEQQLLHEYYELNWSAREIKQKYHITDPQLQRIRNHYGHLYPNCKKRGWSKNHINRRKKQC